MRYYESTEDLPASLKSPYETDIDMVTIDTLNANSLD